MNPLGALLTLDDVRLDVDVSGKEQLLQQIASMLAARHRLPQPVIYENLIAREKMGSTAVGHGVAIPHARMTQCVAAACVFVRTKTAIPFDAPDGRLVSVFLGLIVPNMANERHLQLLAAAAGMMSDRTFRDKLKAATDPKTVLEFLAAWPDAPATAEAPQAEDGAGQSD